MAWDRLSNPPRVTLLTYIALPRLPTPPPLRKKMVDSPHAMSAFDVGVLLRTWSSTSAGELACGKLSHGWSAHNFTGQQLHGEFEQHRQREAKQPTALVSTTSNFLRALHFAYSKAYKGEDLDQITIAFIAIDSPSPAKIHNARDLAGGSISNEKVSHTHKGNSGYGSNLPLLFCHCQVQKPL